MRSFAFNAQCPHASCPVGYDQKQNRYLCPCHKSSFGIGGERSDGSPAARDLDTLDVQIRNGDVWVKYQDFKAGIKEKKPLS